MASELVAIEKEYAAKLAAVATKYQQHGGDATSTGYGAWRAVLGGVTKISASHGAVANTIEKDVLGQFKSVAKQPDFARIFGKIRDGGTARNAILQKMAQLDSGLATEMHKVDKVTKKYEKSARESEKAKAEYTKAEQADNVTKAKVEKLHASWAKKAKETSSVEQELANEIRAVNGARTMHFHTHIPAEMDKLQTAHETVWTMLVDAFNKLGMCYNYLHTHANEAASDVATAVQAYSGPKDSDAYVAALLKGAAPKPLPPDLDPFPYSEKSQPEPVPAAQQQPRPAAAVEPAPEPEPEEPAMKQCRCVYEFAGSNEGELATSANDVLGVVTDDGSGWVLCMRLDNMQQGYVPSSYVEML